MTPKEARIQDDGRGRRRADLDRADALRRVRALGLPVGHLGPVLPPVRRHDRGLDGDLLLRLADAQPGSLRGALQTASGCRQHPDQAGSVASCRAVFESLQSRLRVAVERLWSPDAASGAGDRHRAGDLRAADRRSPAFSSARAPTGFIPEQDQGYLITVVQLPPGATLDRTEAVVKRAIDIILKTPGVEHVAPFAGLDATTFTVASNAGTIFSGLPSLYNHDARGRDRNDGAG